MKLVHLYFIIWFVDRLLADVKGFCMISNSFGVPTTLKNKSINQNIDEQNSIFNKPYAFNWTKNKCLSCICHIETCDSELSFHESEQTVPAVNAISSDFLCINF